MNKIIASLILSIISILAYSQDGSSHEIKMFIIDNDEPLPGVSIYIGENISNNAYDTNFDGEAKIKVRKDIDFVILSFMGPRVRVKIQRPTDSIVVNLKRKRAYYYLNGERMKKRKIKIYGF